MPQVDLSICNDSGLRAAYYLRQWSDRLPALRPLVLVNKLLLREHSLNDVASGGLGSWALANMVMAHLRVGSGPLQGLLRCVARSALATLAAAAVQLLLLLLLLLPLHAAPCSSMPQRRSMPATPTLAPWPALLPQLEEAAGADMCATGRLLHSFLTRFSQARFDYTRSGISLEHPGIVVPKRALGLPLEARLAIKDPLTGGPARRAGVGAALLWRCCSSLMVSKRFGPVRLSELSASA
jgi:DNA polymerase sigma